MKSVISLSSGKLGMAAVELAAFSWNMFVKATWPSMTVQLRNCSSILSMLYISAVGQTERKHGNQIIKHKYMEVPDNRENISYNGGLR